jgi:hypothetical protein
METGNTTRRQFLQGLLGGAVVAATPRIWQVGAKLIHRPTTAEVMAVSPQRGGLVPVEGQPGLFRDKATGKIVNIRDFHEDDRFDNIIIPPGYALAG